METLTPQTIPQPHLITHVETAPATTQAEQMTDPIHQALAAKNLLLKEHLLDRGYVDTQVLIDSQQKHRGARDDQSRHELASSIAERVSASCFTIDWEHQKIICPNGRVSQVWTENHKDLAGQPRIYLRFAKNSCQACPVRTDCTRSPEGSRTLSFKPRSQFELLQWARQREHTLEFKERYAKRAGIEGTISQATRSFDLRRSRYLGQPKTHLQHILIAVAINLVRFVDWINQIPQATTRTSALAAHALA